jgi:hypothetical protein
MRTCVAILMLVLMVDAACTRVEAQSIFPPPCRVTERKVLMETIHVPFNCSSPSTSPACREDAANVLVSNQFHERWRTEGACNGACGAICAGFEDSTSWAETSGGSHDSYYDPTRGAHKLEAWCRCSCTSSTACQQCNVHQGPSPVMDQSGRTVGSCQQLDATTCPHRAEGGSKQCVYRESDDGASCGFSQCTPLHLGASIATVPAGETVCSLATDATTAAPLSPDGSSIKVSFYLEGLTASTRPGQYEWKPKAARVVTTVPSFDATTKRFEPLVVRFTPNETMSADRLGPPRCTVRVGDRTSTAHASCGACPYAFIEILKSYQRGDWFGMTGSANDLAHVCDNCTAQLSCSPTPRPEEIERILYNSDFMSACLRGETYTPPTMGTVVPPTFPRFSEQEIMAGMLEYHYAFNRIDATIAGYAELHTAQRAMVAAVDRADFTNARLVEHLVAAINMVQLKRVADTLFDLRNQLGNGGSELVQNILDHWQVYGPSRRQVPTWQKDFANTFCPATVLNGVGNSCYRDIGKFYNVVSTEAQQDLEAISALVAEYPMLQSFSRTLRSVTWGSNPTYAEVLPLVASSIRQHYHDQSNKLALKLQKLAKMRAYLQCPTPENSVIAKEIPTLLAGTGEIGEPNYPSSMASGPTKSAHLLARIYFEKIRERHDAKRMIADVNQAYMEITGSAALTIATLPFGPTGRLMTMLLARGNLLAGRFAGWGLRATTGMSEVRAAEAGVQVTNAALYAMNTARILSLATLGPRVMQFMGDCSKAFGAGAADGSNFNILEYANCVKGSLGAATHLGFMALRLKPGFTGGATLAHSNEGIKTWSARLFLKYGRPCDLTKPFCGFTVEEILATFPPPISIPGLNALGISWIKRGKLTPVLDNRSRITWEWRQDIAVNGVIRSAKVQLYYHNYADSVGQFRPNWRVNIHILGEGAQPPHHWALIRDVPSACAFSNARPIFEFPGLLSIPRSELQALSALRNAGIIKPRQQEVLDAEHF